MADQGVGIGDVNRAMEPLFTTRPKWNVRMGFAFMEAFMDELHVESQVGQGTTIRMKKKFIVHLFCHKGVCQWKP